jgi:predicted Zn-dependent protease
VNFEKLDDSHSWVEEMQLNSRPSRTAAALIRSAFLAGLCALTACSTIPEKRRITPQEQVQQDQSLGVKISAPFESHLKLKQDMDVAVYLRKIGANLAEMTPELKGSPLGIFLMKDEKLQPRWRCYGLPGNRIYLSVGLLRGLEFENEVAAAISVEFAHILLRHAVTRFEKLRNPQDSNAPIVAGDSLTAADYFGTNGIFAFEDDDVVAAFRSAVLIMYRAGYDPRGLTALLSRFEKNPAKSPYPASLIARVEQQTRQEIAQYAPLRNPIVRSEAFVSVQKRIRRL